MRTPFVMGTLVLALAGPVALGQEVSLRVTGSSQNGAGQWKVPVGGTVNWEIWASVSDDGDPTTGGIAGISVDLATDLRSIAAGFELSPAASLGLPANFDNQKSLGVVINDASVSVLHTIGGAQDTPDNLPAQIEVQGPDGPELVDFPQGIVIPGVGEGAATLIAQGSFVVPAEAVAGTEFTLLTGGAPGNPGQTKLAALVAFGAGPDPNDPINPCGTGNPNDCGGDFQWTAELFDANTIPPLAQPQGPASPLALIVVPDDQPAPELVRVAGSLDTAPDTFVSPAAETVPFTSFQIEATEPVTMTGQSVVFTGDPANAPAVGSLADNGNGIHTVVLSRALETSQWAKITINVVSAGGTAGTLVVFVAHLPGNINQDNITNIRDATAFGVEFNSGGDPLVLDLNGDDRVDIRDATTFGSIWNGVAPDATTPWQGVQLPAKP